MVRGTYRKVTRLLNGTKDFPRANFSSHAALTGREGQTQAGTCTILALTQANNLKATLQQEVFQETAVSVFMLPDSWSSVRASHLR